MTRKVLYAESVFILFVLKRLQELNVKTIMNSSIITKVIGNHKWDVKQPRLLSGPLVSAPYPEIDNSPVAADEKEMMIVSQSMSAGQG